MTKMVVFEGIDNSGKTTISRQLSRMLGVEWTKEPTFTTAVADMLNSGSCQDPFKREFLFLASRIDRQQFYHAHDCLVDRYLWTGLAYAKVFSPETFDLCTGIYTNYLTFKKPDLYVFMDTPVETCHAREPGVSCERLEKIRSAYMDTKELVSGTPIITVDGTLSVDEILRELEPQVKEVLGC